MLQWQQQDLMHGELIFTRIRLRDRARGRLMRVEIWHARSRNHDFTAKELASVAGTTALNARVFKQSCPFRIAYCRCYRIAAPGCASSNL
jgi:hypothetical protein